MNSLYCLPFENPQDSKDTGRMSNKALTKHRTGFTLESIDWHDKHDYTRRISYQSQCQHIHCTKNSALRKREKNKRGTENSTSKRARIRCTEEKRGEGCVKTAGTRQSYGKMMRGERETMREKRGGREAEGRERLGAGPYPGF